MQSNGIEKMSIKDRIQKIAKNDNLNMNTDRTTVKVELSGMCTLDCSFCYQRKMKEHNERQKLMSAEDFTLIIKNLDEVKTIKEIGLFYMGESGIHPMLADFYRMIKEHGYFTYLTTNGTSLKYVFDAVPFIDSLKISWNYKDVNDFIRKTRKPAYLYAFIIQNIAILKNKCNRYGKKLAVSTILDCKNKDEYAESLKTIEYDEHYWLPLQTQGGVYTLGADGVIGEYDNAVKPIPCWSAFKGIYIDVNMDVRTCCYGHSKEHIIGNLKKQRLEDILKSERIEKIKQQQLRGEIPDVCKNCLRQTQ